MVAAWKVIKENARLSKSLLTQNEIKTFDGKIDSNIDLLQRDLRSVDFKFPQALGKPIQKPGKSTFRPLVVTDVRTRVIQRAVLDVLVTIPALRKYLENPHSFGGVRKRKNEDLSAVPAAIKAVLGAIENGARYVAFADISGFFTKISKSEVVSIIEPHIRDDRFLDLLKKSISVELSNMAELREKSSQFPIEDIGVAQGSSLSPFLGNVLLFEFDKIMNVGECSCIRYIDDFIILGKTKEATEARYREAELYLGQKGMVLSKEKSSVGVISVESKFEFLGIEFANGHLRPNKAAIAKIIQNIDEIITDSTGAFRALRSGVPIKHSFSYVLTLKKIDGVIQGWSKHYRFCNDMFVLKNLDSVITDKLEKYIGEFRRTITRIDASKRRDLLGVSSLASMDREPFVWPKKSKIGSP